MRKSPYTVNEIKTLFEGYKVLPAIDTERYPSINGLEGPFRTLSGHVVYYDPKEGSYYDKDRDMYISYDEFRQMDDDYSDMTQGPASFKLKVTNPATGNSEIQEFNSDRARRDYAKRLKQRGLKTQVVDESMLSNKFDPDYLPDQDYEKVVKNRLKHNAQIRDLQKQRREKTDEANTSYEKDMDHSKPVVVRGVKGMKSTPFRKKFKNMAAYDRWSDSEEASNYEVHDIMNESVLSESDIVNFSSFAGMYSDGAHAYFTGRDGRVHKVSATGDSPRKFYINGQETPWEDVKRIVGNQHIQPLQGMMHESSVNEELNEAMKLDKVNIIVPGPGTEQFAKHYRAGMIGDYRPGGPSPKDEANAEKFHTIYSSKETRSGFAGSGTTVYINNKTGEQFEVDRTGNGKGFYGTDHSIRKIEPTNESVEQIDEISKSLAHNYYRKASKDISDKAKSATDYRGGSMDLKYRLDRTYNRDGSRTTDDDRKKDKDTISKYDAARKNAERKIKNRAVGMSRASSRMEEVEQIDEAYSDRVQQVADRVNKSYPDGVTRAEMLKLITQFGQDQVEMRSSEKTRRDFIKDVSAKVKTRRDTSGADAKRATKEKILSYLASAIETAVGNSMPDGDPWDALEVKGRKLGIYSDDLLKYLDLAARKHLGTTGYHDYVSSMWDAYGSGDLGTDPGPDWKNPWKAESVSESLNETTSASGIAAVAQPLGKMIKRKKIKESKMISEAEFDEAAGEKDACYHKVKSRYKVWPSAYASGALAKCRKVGAKNWGNNSK